MGERTLSTASDHSGSGTGSGLVSPATPTTPAKSSSMKPRAKALAMALTGHSRNASYADLPPTESKLPHDPFVNGQLIEVYLYKDATECPICFLSYPPYLNSTRCCDQPICSECFVQIKRADPHLPEHHPDGQARDPNQELAPEDPPEMLMSEPSACPYCQQPEFGVTYEPPPFRRGMIYSSSSTNLASSSNRSPMSSQSSLHSTAASPTNLAPQTGRRRGHSLSANAPNVITTDRIRPDWSAKLAAVRNHQARRAAAATALHTAAFLVGGGGSEQRSILRSGRFGRRNTGSGSGTGTPGNGLEVDGNESAERASSMFNADGTRRSRMDELEDMMFMEAVRLSLAAEEERKKKELKAYRKDAKKREQAEKKAAKKAAKDPYGGSVSGASGSNLSLGLGRKRGNSAASNLRVEATVHSAVHSASQSPKWDSASEHARDASPAGDGSSSGKGKLVDRQAHDAPTDSGASLAIPIRSGGSHLRQMSNASSLGSSLADSAPGSYTGTGFHPDGRKTRSDSSNGGDEGSEPMFNFRSLAELVGVNIDEGTAIPEHDEEETTEGVEAAATIHKDKEPETEPEHVETCGQESLGRPLSQVKEEGQEDEYASEHKPSVETVETTEKPGEKKELEPRRALDTEETLTSTTEPEEEQGRVGGGKSPEGAVLVENAVSAEAK